MIPKITILPGDGIGPEVTEAAVKVFELVSKKTGFAYEIEKKSFGGASFDKYGECLTNDTLKACLNSKAVFMGAIGGPKWENLVHKRKPEAGLLKLRKSLELFANIRPTKVYSSIVDSSSLKREILEGTDFVVIRELTGGIYFGEPRGMNGNEGWNTMKYSREEVIRIAHIAFQTAAKRRKKVISVDKANVLEVSQFWRSIVAEIHKEYSDIDLQNMYVDNAAMQIVAKPKQFDVILTSNLFGDILSDIAGSITGSLGMLPSASLGSRYALYEPVHGSAPDIAGKNIANPIAAISSIAMMFQYSFNDSKVAGVIDQAISKVLEQGYRTQDIASGTDNVVTTEKLTELILLALSELL